MKLKDIQILAEAVEDLEKGYVFYNEQEAGVGEYFWDSLFADVESLVIYAGIHGKKFGFYRMLSKRFPYAVYYEVRREVAYVVAVLPMRRSPAWIKNTMSDRVKQ